MAQNANHFDHVLDDVISGINRITEHLRRNNEVEMARDLTSTMTSAFETLCNITSDWTEDRFQMSPVQATPVTGIDTNRTSWAAVTATPPPATQPDIVKYTPADTLKRRISEESGEVPDIYPNASRVLWVRPWSASRPLKEVTKQIKNLGAIYSIAFDPDTNQVCVIFQNIADAAHFFHQTEQHIQTIGRSPLGPDVTVSFGQPYHDSDIEGMNMPQGERRRLTFARQQLFAHGLTEAKFRAELEKLVRASDIEVLHLFNTGNATVVFSAVPLARLVREHFQQLSQMGQSQYVNVMVSYSSDPCEKPLNLVRSDHWGYRPATGANGTPLTVQNGNIPRWQGRSQTAGSGDTSPKHKEKGGWTTVKRR